METATFAVEDVYTEPVIDVFYIFNSTVIDWTCLFVWQLATADQRVAEVKNDSCRIQWGALYLLDIMA